MFQTSILYVFLSHFVFANLFPLCVQLAMRGPTGPMGLTGRSGPLVRITSRHRLKVSASTIWSADVVARCTRHEYRSWVEHFY